MRSLLLGCFSTDGKRHTKRPKRSSQSANRESRPQDAVGAIVAGMDQLTGETTESQQASADAQAPVAARAASLTRNRAGRTATADAAIPASQRQPDSSGQGDAATKEQQEAPVPRLSLDCGVGIGPLPPQPPTSVAPPASSNLSFTRLPGPSLPLALIVGGSVDNGSADTASSDGSSGILAVRGGAAAAALAAPPHPGDLTTAGSRHLVSRALRGRASLDALLMLGALVRAADEAGLAVTALGGTPRLERIESGDLPPGEDGHQDRQGQSRSSRFTTAEAAEAEARPEWCAKAEAAAPRVVTRSPRRGALRWPQPAQNGAGGGGGPAAASAVALVRSSDNRSSSTAGPGGSGGSAATTAAAAAAITAFCRTSNDDFTFSPPAPAGSLGHSAAEISRGQGSEVIPGQQPPGGSPPPQPQLGAAIADSNQVLELFMRLVTNCSTVCDNDQPSSSWGGDRSSASTAGAVPVPGSRAGTGTGTAPTSSAAAAPVSGQLAQTPGQRSISERQRHINGKRPASAVDGGGSAASSTSEPPLLHTGGGPVTAAATAGAAPLWLRAAVDRTGSLHCQQAGSSAPLLKVHGGRPGSFARGGAGDGGSGGGSGFRRNSWDTLRGSSGSAVAVAAAAAAALATAGLLRASVSSRNGGAAAAAVGGSNSGKNTGTGSASRFWPAGGVLQEDSGPASMLMLGALSGGLSVGGTTSAASLVRLPTGSSSVRDVLSRMHQGTQQQGPPGLLHSPHVVQEAGNGGNSSSSWSAHTGLASLFDAHLTAALHRNGAVRIFQRALGGPATLSHTSSATSQLMTGNLGRQDTSLTLTSGLLMLHFGSTAGSSSATASGGVGVGVSQLGAATAASAAATAAGIIVNGLRPQQNVRRATISSISTIHSSPEVCSGGAAAAAASGGAVSATRCGGTSGVDDVMDDEAAVAAAAWEATAGLQWAGVRPASRFLPCSEGGSAGEPRSRAQLHKQLRAFVERHHPQQQQAGPPPAQVHQRQQQQQLLPRRQLHVQNAAPERGTTLARSPGWQGAHPPSATEGAGPSGDGAAGAATHVTTAAPATAQQRNGRLPSVNGCSLSLALGLAAGVPDSGAPNGTSGPGDGAPQPSPSHLPAQLADEGAAARFTAATSLGAGPVGLAWLQPHNGTSAIGGGGGGGEGPSGRGGAAAGPSDLSASLGQSLDFSRYSWDTDWGPPARGPERGETFTFTGPSSFSHGRPESAVLREGAASNPRAGLG